MITKIPPDVKVVWSAAGFNILRIGILAYPNYRSV